MAHAAAKIDSAFKRAVALRQQRRLDEARSQCRIALKLRPNHVSALALLGAIELEANRPQSAAEALEQAIGIDPLNALLHFDLGNGRFMLLQYAAAIACYDRAIELGAAHADAFYNRGNAQRRLGMHEASVASYDRVIALNPRHAEAHNNKGNALTDLGRYAPAVASYTLAIALNPKHPQAYMSRGNALFHLKRYAAAVASYDQVIARTPADADAHFNRGTALLQFKQYEAAVADFDATLAIHPDHAGALNNRGNALRALRRFATSLASFDRALALQPGAGNFHYNRGNVLREMRRPAEALAAYDRALALHPGLIPALIDRGVALYDLRRHEDAVASLERAQALEPGNKRVRALLRDARIEVCDWRDLDADMAEAAAGIATGKPAARPSSLLLWSDSAALQLAAVTTWNHVNLRFESWLEPIPQPPRRERIRIGYFFGDDEDQATMGRVAAMLALHDRSLFHLTAFSLRQDRQCAARTRLAACCDEFIDLSDVSDREAALLARSREIDIAVDTCGISQVARAAVFAMRAAPVQVNYPGYPATMGVPYMDYLIADHTVIPAASERHYTEKIVYLPDSHQWTDLGRAAGPREFTREELGLTAAAFVFCCFNRNRKIMPRTFASWMRILLRVPGSVLWLLPDNPTAAANLKRMAAASGVAAERLVFAPHLPPGEHLARLGAADLCLDTAPCNGRQSAGDALWSGLPVLTLAGEAFAARVGASLLHAAGFPELITTTSEQYEASAVALATEPQRLAGLKQRLTESRLTTPLFNARLNMRRLEHAYLAMQARSVQGLPPEHIWVD